MENLERFIKEQEFFKDFEPEFVHLIVGCASNVVFKKGEYLFHTGDEAHNFYVIRDGKVAIEIPFPGHGSITIQTLGKGEVIGWSWLFPPYNWRFSAIAKEDTRALAFDGECLRSKCEENHHLGYELMKRFSQVVIKRLDSTRLQLLEVIEEPEQLSAAK